MRLFLHPILQLALRAGLILRSLLFWKFILMTLSQGRLEEIRAREVNQNILESFSNIADILHTKCCGFFIVSWF